MDYEDLVKAGYWVGGTASYANRCSCPGSVQTDELGEVHPNVRCARWMPEHARRAKANRLPTKDYTNR